MGAVIVRTSRLKREKQNTSRGLLYFSHLKNRFPYIWQAPVVNRLEKYIAGAMRCYT